MAGFFKVEGRPITSKDWGDYGDMLQHGMAVHLPRQSGSLALERTGPFVPFVTLPGIGDLVLTETARHELAKSELTGFTFRQVTKAHIVDLAWETWDLTAAEPAEYPDSGEPEDYILARPHDPTISEQIGELWEIVVPFNIVVVRPSPVVQSYAELHVELASWDGSDLVRATEYGGMLFSEKAKDWFSARWPDLLTFHEFAAR